MDTYSGAPQWMLTPAMSINISRIEEPEMSSRHHPWGIRSKILQIVLTSHRITRPIEAR